MKKHVKLSLSAILLFLIVVGAQAQTGKKEMKGSELFKAFNYEKAIEKFEASDNLTLKGKRELAEAYRFTNNTDSALNAYKKVVNDAEASAADFFKYAQVLKMKQNYEESDVWMAKFNKLNGKDSRGEEHVSKKGYSSALLIDGGIFTIDTLKNVNSDEEDFSPSFYKNQLIFCSSRKKTKPLNRKWNGTKLPFLDMYTADTIKGGELENIKVFNTSNNKKYHDGPASFTKDGKLMVFTRNNYDSSSTEGTTKLQLFYAYATEDAWEDAKAFQFNNKEHSVGHPSITPEGNEIYFASDMKGGYGGTDIYKISLNEFGKWGSPINLGNKVNTEGNELFPFIHSETNTLYFASNGHISLGGLDIFSSSLKDTSIVNLGHPMNTPKDDFGLILNTKGTGGYFSSNRDGGKGFDDIYGFRAKEAIVTTRELIGKTINKQDSIVPLALVKLFNTENEVIDSTLSDSLGLFSFTVEKEQDFNFTATKENYLPGATKYKFKEATDTIVLVLDQLTVGTDLAKVLQINPIYFDLNKANIRPDAAVELDKIVAIMNEYPSMEIELGSHTDCRASRAYNRRLSNRRAVSSAKYIKEKIKNPERIYGKGYGESKLVNHCECEGSRKVACTEDEHQKNRRTEFVIIKI